MHCGVLQSAMQRKYPTTHTQGTASGAAVPSATFGASRPPAITGAAVGEHSPDKPQPQKPRCADRRT